MSSEPMTPERLDEIRARVQAARTVISKRPADCTDNCGDAPCDCSGVTRPIGWSLDPADAQALLAELDQRVRVWSCPDCAFSFDAAHVDDTPEGGYSCPLCDLNQLHAHVAELASDVIELRGQRDTMGADLKAKYAECDQLGAALNQRNVDLADARTENARLQRACDLADQRQRGHEQRIADLEGRLERHHAYMRGLRGADDCPICIHERAVTDA